MNDLTPTQRAAVADAAREAVRDELAATDPAGERVTFGGLLDTGLTRRQALAVLGAVAAGVLLDDALAVGVEAGERSPPSTASLPALVRGAQTAVDGLVVPVGEGLGIVDAIDPARTDTPVQDAVEAVAAVGGGRVFLPPVRLVEAETVRMVPSVELQGYWGRTVLAFPPGVDGLLFDAGGDDFVTYAGLDGVTLQGPGADVGGGVAIRDRGTWLSRFGRVEFLDWNGVVWLVEEGARSFDNRFEYLYFTDCDAGDASAGGDGLIAWNSYGSVNRFGQITAFPTREASGRESRLLATRGLAATVGTVNAGGSVGTVVGGSYLQLHVDSIHWEPTNQPSPTEAVLDLVGPAPFTLNNLMLAVDATARYAYALRDSGRTVLPVPYVADDARLTDATLLLRDDPASHVTYHGPSSDVRVEGSGTTGLCHCIGDFTSVG